MGESWIFGIVLATLSVCALLAAITWIPPLIVKQIQRRQLITKSTGLLALTYDDGPGELLTPALIELLQRYDTRATFFIVGFRADRFPTVCERIQSAGHEIGSHTHFHRKPWKQFPWQEVRDAVAGMRTVSRWSTSCPLFRAPFGKLSTWTWFAMKRRGATLAWWTIDGGDTWPTLPDPNTIVDRVKQFGGGVVLLHNHDRGEDRQKYVLDVTELLVKYAKEEGLRVCTMTEVLSNKS